MALQALARRGATASWQHLRQLSASTTTLAGDARGDDGRTAGAVLTRTMLLPMPKLSPTMTHGRVAKWHVAEGDAVSVYDVVLTVATDTLVEEAYRLDQFAGTVALLVESQEEGLVARLLVAEGEEVEVGVPIALLCEQADELPAARDLLAVGGPLTRVRNVYERQGLAPLRLLEWQSYLAEGPPSSGCL